MALTAQTCAYHPERSGYALCMSCRKVVCEECATTWAGVNYCRTCLAVVRVSVERPISPWRWLVFGALGLALFLVTGWAMVWAGALWAVLL